MPDYCYRILAKRPDYAATITSEEMALMGAHFGYLQGLQAAGRIVFVGRAENGDFGIVVFRADDLDAARATAAADPAVAAGIVGVEVHTFMVVPMA